MVWKLLKVRAILSFLAVIAALLVAAPAWAQTTGQLRITVVDQEGLEVPGVTLRLEGDTLIGGAQERLTDGLGAFLFTELPPGTYQLQATKGGFGGVTTAGIKINISRTTQIRVEMNANNVEEVIVEAKQKAVDVESTSRSQVLTKEFLERIPAGRSYQTAVTFASGVQDNGTGNPNIGGAFNENTYMLDGVNITDPVTGTFSVNFNFDAIQQIEVLLGGYMPEYGTSVGGIVSVVTESGTNNLEYDTSIFYRNGDFRPRMDERITADGFVQAPTGFDQTFQSYQISAKLSGPIVRDKAWFILSYQADRSLIAVTGSPQARDYEGHYMLAKLTAQPSTEHRFTAFLQTDPTNVANVVQGTPFIEAAAQGQQTQGGYILSGRWQWFLGPEVNLETTAFVQKSYIEVNSVPCTHDRNREWHPCEPDEREGHVDFETPGRLSAGGGAFDSTNYLSYNFDDRIRYSVNTKLSLLSVDDPLGGTHDFKFGAEGIQLVWDRLVGFNGNHAFFDRNSVPFDPTSLENYYWIETSGPIDYRTSSSQYNFFAQDSWKPVSNLTLNWGTRFDAFVIRNDLGDPVISGALFGPRLFGSWDPFKDQKTKIATGFGRFNDTGRLGVANYSSASGFGQKLFLGETFDEYLQTGQNLFRLFPRENLNTAYDNLRTPRVDELLLILEREIMEDVAISSRMSGKFSRFMFEPDDVNLIWDEDGSAVIGSRLADPSNIYGRLRTPALAKRDYYQWDVELRKVWSRRWEARLTYTYTNAVGSSTQSLSGSFLNDPQTQYNYGNLNTDLRHMVVGYASWDLPTDPWTQNISAVFRLQDGFPFDRFYFSEFSQSYGVRIRPRGTYYRANPTWFVSLGFSQAFDVRKGQILVQVNVENITNNRAPDSWSAFGLYQQNRLFAVSRQDPLRVQAGLRYRF